MNWWVRSIEKSLELYWTLTFLVSTVTGCVSISDFASLVGFPVSIAFSAVGLKFDDMKEEIKNSSNK